MLINVIMAVIMDTAIYTQQNMWQELLIIVHACRKFDVDHVTLPNSDIYAIQLSPLENINISLQVLYIANYMRNNVLANSIT